MTAAAALASATATGARLARLRELLADRRLHAFIVPSEDAHQSEYIAPCDARRAFISGFTGSAGVAVVTTEKAALWTDGRYFLQASQQLDANWILQKSGMPNVPSKTEWLSEVLPKSGGRVGIDAELISVAEAKTLSEAFAKTGHTLVNTENLVDLIWTDRPERPVKPVTVLDLKYAGMPFEEKITAIQHQLVAKKRAAFVVTALDEIAWLLNLRGADIEYNPVLFAYALVTVNAAYLFIDETKLTDAVKDHLMGKVIIRPYTAIFEHLKVTCAEMTKAVVGDASAASINKIWIDSRCSLAVKEALGGDDFVDVMRSPIQTAKAIKNSIELQGFRNCHIRDAAALCRYFSWLEDELVNKKNTTLTEAAAADRLEQFRSELPQFVGLSFDTISSTGANGAIIHYKPEHGSCAVIDVDKMYLCDSGGQYLDGTTDVTRTLHFGTPTAREKDAFTRVLKGHIQIDMLVFPEGTTGYIIDPIARMALWRAGLDFRHGTGHGVGAFLNVHEGPQGIGMRIAYNDIKLEAGMTITNEPGYYEDGAFGIRIENVLLIKKVNVPNRFGDRDYLGFEHVTVVPIQTKLIDVSLLTREERGWVNTYNRQCFDLVSPLLSRDDMAFKWLERETQPIA